MGILQEWIPELLWWKGGWVPFILDQQKQSGIKATQNKEDLLRQPKQPVDCQTAERTYKGIFQEWSFTLSVPDVKGYPSTNELRSIMEDADHNIWVGGKNGDIQVYDKDKTSLAS